MNVNAVVRLDLIGLEELIGMVDGDEMIAGQTKSMACFRFNGVEQS